MIKLNQNKKLCWILYFLSNSFISLNAFAGHPPVLEESFTHYQADLRLWKKYRSFRFLGEMQFAKQDGQSNFKAIRLGTKYKISKRIKSGLYIKRSYGLRHDDDWIASVSGNNAVGFWKDTSERGENKLISEIEFLDLLPFKKTISYHLNLAYEYNFYNDQQSLKVRPGLSIFAMPRLVIFLRYQVYLPLNFSEVSIYAKWAYLGTFYKVASHFKLGPYLAYGKETWTTSKSFKMSDPAESYEASQEITRIGMALNFYY